MAARQHVVVGMTSMLPHIINAPRRLEGSSMHVDQFITCESVS